MMLRRCAVLMAVVAVVVVAAHDPSDPSSRLSGMLTARRTFTDDDWRFLRLAMGVFLERAPDAASLPSQMPRWAQTAVPDHRTEWLTMAAVLVGLAQRDQQVRAEIDAVRGKRNRAKQDAIRDQDARALVEAIREFLSRSPWHQNDDLQTAVTVLSATPLWSKDLVAVALLSVHHRTDSVSRSLRTCCLAFLNRLSDDDLCDVVSGLPSRSQALFLIQELLSYRSVDDEIAQRLSRTLLPSDWVRAFFVKLRRADDRGDLIGQLQRMLAVERANARRHRNAPVELDPVQRFAAAFYREQVVLLRDNSNVASLDRFGPVQTYNLIRLVMDQPSSMQTQIAANLRQQTGHGCTLTQLLDGLPAAVLARVPTLLVEVDPIRNLKATREQHDALLAEVAVAVVRHGQRADVLALVQALKSADGARTALWLLERVVRRPGEGRCDGLRMVLERLVRKPEPSDDIRERILFELALDEVHRSWTIPKVWNPMVQTLAQHRLFGSVFVADAPEIRAAYPESVCAPRSNDDFDAMRQLERLAPPEQRLAVQAERLVAALTREQRSALYETTPKTIRSLVFRRHLVDMTQWRRMQSDLPKVMKSLKATEIAIFLGKGEVPIRLDPDHYDMMRWYFTYLTESPARVANLFAYVPSALYPDIVLALFSWESFASWGRSDVASSALAHILEHSDANVNIAYFMLQGEGGFELFKIRFGRLITWLRQEQGLHVEHHPTRGTELRGAPPGTVTKLQQLLPALHRYCHQELKHGDVAAVLGMIPIAFLTSDLFDAFMQAYERHEDDLSQEGMQSLCTMVAEHCVKYSREVKPLKDLLRGRMRNFL